MSEQRNEGSGVSGYELQSEPIVTWHSVWRLQLEVCIGYDQDDPAAAYQAAADVIQRIKGNRDEELEREADADVVAAAEQRGAERERAQIVEFLDAQRIVTYDQSPQWWADCLRQGKHLGGDSE